MKKIISLLLCLVLMASAVNLSCFSSFAASYDVNKLISLAKKFPNGKYWNHVGLSYNNPDGWTEFPCTHHGSACKIQEGACDCNFYNNAIQCAGYAYKTASELVGTSFSTWEKSTDKLDPSKLCVGDIIRYINNTHSVTVVGVKDNVIAYTGANWGSNCLIRWSSATADKFTGFSYVLHDPKNTNKNTNITFFNDIKPDEISPSIELWHMNNEGNLNVRENPDVTSGIRGSIKADTDFYVTQKVSDGKYLWGRVTDGTVDGWSVLNYAAYVSGTYEKSEIAKPSNVFSQKAVSITWSRVSGADEYILTVFDEKGAKVSSVSSSGTKASYTFAKGGKYSLQVTAKSKFSSTWASVSDLTEVIVQTTNIVSLKSVTLPGEKKLDAGSVEALAVTLNPSNATDTLSWKSSDTSVAKVDKNGKVTALKSGSAVITCTCSQNSTITAKCTVKVRVAQVADFKQNLASSASDKTALSWKAVKGADGYRVYRETAEGDLKKIADTAKTSCTDSGLSSCKKYTYTIRAYQIINEKNVYGDFEETTAITAPKKVTGLKAASFTETSYTLSWTKASGATSYIIYRYDSGKKAYVQYKTTTGTSYKVAAKEGEVKQYKVAAVYKKSGVSLTGAKSDSVYGFVKPKQVKLTATAKSKSAQLSWKSIKGATGYEVYMKVGSSFQKVGTTASDKLTFTKTGLKSKASYVFVVRAITKKGTTTANGAYSSEVKVTAK